MNIPITNVAGRTTDPAVHPSPPTAALPRRTSSALATPPPTKLEAEQHGPRRRQELETELAAANQKLADDGHEMRFEYDRDANRLIVRLVDSNTHEVLRQFPNDEALRAARQIKSGKPLINMRA